MNEAQEKANDMAQANELIEVGDRVSFEHENDIMFGECYAIYPNTIIFHVDGYFYNVPRFWAEQTTVLISKWRDSLIEELTNEIMGMIA